MTLTQPQREAIFDLLLLGTYADDSLKISEDRRLYAMISELGWESYQDPDEYANTATARVRAAAEDDTATADFVDALSTRLGTPEARQLALTLFRRLINADDEVAAAESALHQRVKSVFGL
jgi:hypothetical protein